MRDEVKQSLDKVQQWVEQQQYKGYDPGDGLTSFVRPLTFGNLFAERILQQLIWKSPVNLRPFLGVKPMDSTKGRGFMAWGYLFLYRATGEQSYLKRARSCLDWLDSAAEPGQAGHCWGNHFDFTTRTGRMRAHTPTIVWSGLIGQAFLEAYEVLGDHRYLEIAESICTWILQLPRKVTSDGSCLSYTAAGQSSVHNSNLLGAGLLVRTWHHTRKEQYLAVAREAVTYSCRRQRPDGAWFYAEDPRHHWIDNFHTAYNLDSLKRYIDTIDDTEYLPNLEQGYSYFKRVFFEDSGRPRYYHNQTHPVDIQCSAQAIDTLALFSETDPAALAMASRTAMWTITHMQDTRGHFYYRVYPLIKARTPYFHWGQATMFKALAHLLLKLNGASEESSRQAVSDIHSKPSGPGR